jgi:hypothetical protein
MWKNIVQPGRTQMTLWCMGIACWIPKSANTHSPYVILFAFPLLQWLHSSASKLRYTYIACLVIQYLCLVCGHLTNIEEKEYSHVYISLIYLLLADSSLITRNRIPYGNPAFSHLVKKPQFMQLEISCRYQKSPQLIPTFRYINIAIFLRFIYCSEMYQCLHAFFH